MIPLTQSFCGIPGSQGRATILYLLLLAEGVQLTALQLHNNPHHIQPLLAPFKNSLTIPPGVDPTENTLKGVINDNQIPRSFLKVAFDGATSRLASFITPQKPESALNDANLDTNSETSETSIVNDDKLPPPNSKTYSQKDVDHLLEQSRLQDITDKRNLETHIRNQYSSAMENLKMEHQEQIASMETNIAKKLQKENSKDSGHFRPTELYSMLSPYNCSNKKFKHYNNPNPNTPHMPDYNQSN